MEAIITPEELMKACRSCQEIHADLVKKGYSDNQAKALMKAEITKVMNMARMNKPLKKQEEEFVDEVGEPLETEATDSDVLAEIVGLLKQLVASVESMKQPEPAPEPAGDEFALMEEIDADDGNTAAVNDETTATQSEADANESAVDDVSDFQDKKPDTISVTVTKARLNRMVQRRVDATLKKMGVAPNIPSPVAEPRGEKALKKALKKGGTTADAEYAKALAAVDSARKVSDLR